MAVSNQISLLVDLYKNMMTTSKGYGMIYGRVFSRKGLNLKGFAKHVSDHGGLVKYDLMGWTARTRPTRSVRPSASMRCRRPSLIPRSRTTTTINSSLR